MIVAFQTDWFGVADVIDDLDAGAYIVQTESVASQNLPVTLCVQVGKTVAELKRLSVDDDLPEGGFATLSHLFWQRVSIDTQEVTYSRFLETDESGHAVVGGDVHDVFLHVPEYVAKHVVEMDADVGRDAAAFALGALPTGVIPMASGCNIRQINIIHDIVGGIVHFLLQGDDGRMQSELQNVEYFLTCLVFNVLQHIHIPWIEH